MATFRVDTAPGMQVAARAKRHAHPDSMKEDRGKEMEASLLTAR
jgi:hypothetical protein